MEVITFCTKKSEFNVATWAQWFKVDSFKVQLFWEGQENLYHMPYGFDIYLVNVKTISEIAQIFVALSEKLNFNIIFTYD